MLDNPRRWVEVATLSLATLVASAGKLSAQEDFSDIVAPPVPGSVEPGFSIDVITNDKSVKISHNGNEVLLTQQPLLKEAVRRALDAFEQVERLIGDHFGIEKKFSLTSSDGIFFIGVDRATGERLGFTTKGIYRITEERRTESESVKFEQALALKNRILDDAYMRLRESTRPEYVNKMNAAADQARIDAIAAKIDLKIEQTKEIQFECWQLRRDRKKLDDARDDKSKGSDWVFDDLQQAYSPSYDRFSAYIAKAQLKVAESHSNSVLFSREAADRAIADLFAYSDARPTRISYQLEPVDKKFGDPGCFWQEQVADGRSCMTLFTSCGIEEHFYRGGIYEQHVVHSADKKERVVRTMFPESGTPSSMSKWRIDGERVTCVAIEEYNAAGKLRMREGVEYGQCQIWDQMGKAVAVVEYATAERPAMRRWIYAPDQRVVSTFNVEQTRRAGITSEQYLNLLKDTLTTPERIFWYLKVCLEYQVDINDDWQSATKTISQTNIKHGTHLGDCEDWAFLAREILRRQGTNAHVIMLPNHAECLWITKSNGKYHAFSLGTYGLDQDGITYTVSAQMKQGGGFDNALEAIQSLMKKYRSKGEGSLGFDHQVDATKIELLDLNLDRAKLRRHVNLSYITP